MWSEADEVYWDGLSSRNGSVFLPFRLENSLKAWDNAQASASYASLEMRRILADLEGPVIRVIAHSHGAGVITNASLM